MPGVLISSLMPMSALSLPTAASGTVTTATCLKSGDAHRFLAGEDWQNVQRDRRDIATLVEQGWRVLVVWGALRGRLKLNDRDLTERLEEWICGGGQTAQIDTQGIHPFTISPPDTAPPQA